MQIENMQTTSLALNPHYGGHNIVGFICMHILSTCEFVYAVCVLCALTCEVSKIACAAALMHFIKVNERQRGPGVTMVNISVLVFGARLTCRKVKLIAAPL